MNDILTIGGTEIAVLENLAREAQYYSKAVVNDTIQLGRVLSQAKEHVPHGEWENWIMENAGCSLRSAQMFMLTYKRYGNMPAIAELKERSKVFKLLSLPEGTEEQFLSDNNISEMSCREVEEAVRQVREEMGLEIQKEKKARMDAQDRVRKLEEETKKLPDEVSDELQKRQQIIEDQKKEIERVAASGREAVEEKNRLRHENARLQRDVAEQSEQIEQMQNQYDSIRREMLSIKSAAAKSDADRIPVDELTLEVFGSAVRQFIGMVARLPHMGHTLARMPLPERNAYNELLRTVEGWADSSRRAMDTIYEEVEIHG